MTTVLPRAAALAAAALLWLAAPAPGAASGEQTPLDLNGDSPAVSQAGGGSPSLVRTIVGLAIVIAVIYGVAWVLRQLKASRRPRAVGGGGIASVATVPLGSGRALHLVRAGSELVLLGVAEHGVTPIRTYSEEEARAAGLIDADGALVEPATEDAGRPSRLRRRTRALAPGAGAPGASAPASAPSGAPGAPSLSPTALVATLQRWTVRG